jgi:hypothetical protein
MRPAFIISAYQRPDLLARLAEALRPHPVAIHIDKKSAIGPDVERRLGARPDVAFLPRHICHWGLFGHVEASLEGLKWFLGTSCDYAILLTGQCYPLKSMSDIIQDLADLDGRSIVNHTAFPRPEWLQHDEGGYRRLESFYVKLPLLRTPKRIRLWDRHVPGGLHPYGGSSYWCMSRACADHVVRTVHRNPELVRFFRRTLIPDEMFFQTVLANSTHRDELIDAPIHYFEFSSGGRNPAILRDKSLAAAMASGAWFARKFDDPAVLDRVDRLREGGNPAPAPWRRLAEARPAPGVRGAAAPAP